MFSLGELFPRQRDCDKPFAKDTNSIIDNDGNQDSSFERLERQLHRAILHILNILAPSLYSLSLYLDCASWNFFPFPPTFPVLTDLSIKHPFTDGTLRSNALFTLQSCPKLKRLVLTGFERVADPLKVIDMITIFGPNITHFCIPFNVKNMPHMVQSLQERRATRLHRCSPASTAFPQAIEHLFIHSVGDGYGKYVISALLRSGPKMVLVERAWDKEMIKEEAVKASEAHLVWERMWVDGIGGGGEYEGDGYWKYPDGYQGGGFEPISHLVV
jgi:hypothetical protein